MYSENPIGVNSDKLILCKYFKHTAVTKSVIVADLELKVHKQQEHFTRSRQESVLKVSLFLQTKVI